MALAPTESSAGPPDGEPAGKEAIMRHDLEIGRASGARPAESACGTTTDAWGELRELLGPNVRGRRTLKRRSRGRGRGALRIVELLLSRWSGPSGSRSGGTPALTA
jgi:hypothetical protein